MIAGKMSQKNLLISLFSNLNSITTLKPVPWNLTPNTMLQLNTIREEKDRVLSGLKKRNFKELHLIDNIIALDEKRRATQLSLDETLAKSNNLFKEIGNLFKAGETDKVNALKEQTATLKEDIKTLTDTLNATVE